MNWKKIFIATAAFLFMNSSASAQVVTVQGSGTTELEAIKDAKKIAVEQVLGAFIKSESLMIDQELVFEAVQSRTQGYVTSCEVLKKKSSGGLINVTARVDVSNEPGSALMKDIELVMNLNDPRISVAMEYYGDDNGVNFKKYPAQVEAAIREELIKRGFTHVVDKQGEVDYKIIGRLSVGKAQEIKIPSWRNIGGNDFTPLETGLSRSVSTLNCKIKKVENDEVIGEFQATGDGLDASGNEVSAQSVNLIASSAAQQVREILSREASKVFSSVRIYINASDGDKILKLEEILRQTEGVNGIYVRNFTGGQCIIDADTALTPQNLYQALTQAAGNSLSVQMTGFSSTKLEISLR
ncbi:MAG: hypothetical protein IKT98_00095 [Selenomonadaceae bacterium]|nr:hypothetical protein [Selenomonadaceae bacterium]